MGDLARVEADLEIACALSAAHAYRFRDFEFDFGIASVTATYQPNATQQNYALSHCWTDQFGADLKGGSFGPFPRRRDQNDDVLEIWIAA